MQQQRCHLLRRYQFDHLLAAGKLFAAQFTEQNVALDRLEHTTSILAVGRQTPSSHLTVDPLGHGREQIELIDVQLIQRQQADQRLLVDLREVLAFKRLLAVLDDRNLNVAQQDRLSIAELEHLFVDQAAVSRGQFSPDVVKKQITVVMEQVLVGRLVAFVEFGELEIDLEAVDVPVDRRFENWFKLVNIFKRT